MKKKIFGGIAIAAVALALAFNLSVKQDGPKLSALAMENVEALAGESGYSCTASADCFFGSQKEGSVSCTGTKTCTSGHEYVKCDGHTSSCA